MLNALPQEVGEGDVPRFDDIAGLRTLLLEAETTVLARLTASLEAE